MQTLKRFHLGYEEWCHSEDVALLEDALCKADKYIKTLQERNNDLQSLLMIAEKFIVKQGLLHLYKEEISNALKILKITQEIS